MKRFSIAVKFVWVKVILLFSLSAIALLSKAQPAPPGYNRDSRVISIRGIWASEEITIPTGATPSLPSYGYAGPGAIFIDTVGADSGYYYLGRNGVWHRLARVSELLDSVAALKALIDGVTFDTTSISSRIDLKLNISDTAAMLAAYAGLDKVLNAGNYTEQNILLGGSGGLVAGDLLYNSSIVSGNSLQSRDNTEDIATIVTPQGIFFNKLSGPGGVRLYSDTTGLGDNNYNLQLPLKNGEIATTSDYTLDAVLFNGSSASGKNITITDGTIGTVAGDFQTGAGMNNESVNVLNFVSNRTSSLDTAGVKIDRSIAGTSLRISDTLISFKKSVYSQKIVPENITSDNTLIIPNKSGTLATLDDIAGGSGGVDSIWRTPGVDSIYWRKSGFDYAIKDSVGGGSGITTSANEVIVGTGANTAAGNSSLTFNGTSLGIPDGSSGAAAIKFNNGGSSNLGFYRDASNRVTYQVGSTNYYSFNSSLGLQFHVNSYLGWSSSGNSAGNIDTKLYRGPLAGIIAQRDGLNPQEHRIYNSYNGTNDEFISIGAQNESNVFQIFSEKTGAGTARPLKIIAPAVHLSDSVFLDSNKVYTTGGYDVLVRNQASGRIETITQNLPVITSGTETVSVENVSGLDTYGTCTVHYSRIGDIVTVSGHLLITATGGAATFEVELPIASDLTNASDASGTCTAGEDKAPAALNVNVTDNRVSFEFDALTNVSQVIKFIYQYKVQ